MEHIEHPDIAWIQKTGYPRDYKEPEPFRCPVCNAVVEEYVHINRDGEIVGCDRCISIVEYYEL